MANTDLFLSLPSTIDGVVLLGSPAGAWRYGNTAIIDASTIYDIYIYGVTFQPTFAMSADIRYEMIIDIMRGTQETTFIQIPYSLTNDTAVGFYANGTTVFLPEPVFVPQYTMLSVKMASHINGQAFRMDGFKILYQGTRNISVPTTTFNNYQRFRGGISPGGVM